MYSTLKHGRMKKHANYCTEDFLSDLFFVDWVSNKTPKGEIYFSQLIKDYPHTAKHIEEARSILLKTSINVPTISNQEIDESWKEFSRIVDKRLQIKTKRHKNFVRWSISAAAIALIVLSISIFRDTYSYDEPDYTAIMNEAMPANNHNEVQLILSENEVWTIEKNEQIAYSNGFIIVSQDINGTEKVHLKRKITKKDFLNKLIVPKGRRMNILLADGSKLWINSETTIIFPVAFNGDKREIFVDGEVFLDVARDVTKKFIAKTCKMDVTVLGTSFNLSAYAEDEEQSVALVTGNVEITRQENNQKIILQPNERYKQTGDASGSVETVNALDYASWKDGFMKVDSESLESIIKRLERHYDILIQYAGNQNIYLKCRGKLQLANDVRFVLTNIENAAPIKFIKEGNRYIVK